VTNRYDVHGVFKIGRTSGLTRGVVSAFELDVTVNYGTPGRPHWITFDDQIEITSPPTHRGARFSQPGDSGSVIYQDATRRPFALLFGGGPDANGIDRTVAHFLPDVLNAFDVAMA